VEYPEWSSQSDVPLPEFIDAIEPVITCQYSHIGYRRQAGRERDRARGIAQQSFGGVRRERGKKGGS
jgi:hypothetical protein